MKRVKMLLPLALGWLLAGCQSAPTPDAPAAMDNGGAAVAEKPQGYVALPGQAATEKTRTEADEAFEAAAAALKAHASKPAEPQVEAATLPEEPEPINADPPAVARPAEPAVVEANPQESENAVVGTPAQPELPKAEPAAAPVEMGQPSDSAGYALQITNGTLGRLFIEVQDSTGNIFPFGFMYSYQRLCSQPQEPKPIQGQLTIVIRDPDSPGAPEVRRYHVTPPPNYMGKTLSVTILPGRYRVAVDGEVYYTSPLPEETAAEN